MIRCFAWLTFVAPFCSNHFFINIYFMMVPVLWIFLLLIFDSVLSDQSDSVLNEIKDISVRCQHIRGTPKSDTFMCNFTDHRPASSCPSGLNIIPHFTNISITCALYGFLSIHVKCKIVDLLKPEDENNIMNTSSAVYYNDLNNITTMDMLVKFESILSNALAIGKAFVRCSMPEHHDPKNYNCSLVGIGNKASTTANLSCSIETESSIDKATLVARCGFSEDHGFGKLSGNLSVDLKSVDHGERLFGGLRFSTRSNTPNLNTQESLRGECQQSRNEEGNFYDCGLYLDGGSSCENSAASEENHEIEEIWHDLKPDKLWNLDRKLTFNVDQFGMGNMQFFCNMAGYSYAPNVLTCSAKHSFDSVYLDDKAIIDVTYNRSTIYVDCAELLLFNKTDAFHIHEIIFNRCYFHLNPYKITCDISIGRTKLMHLECNIQEVVANDTYSVTCNFDDAENIIEGTFTYPKRDPNIIQFAFDGQLKTPGSDALAEFNFACTIRSTSTESVMDNSDWDIDCNNEVSFDQMCEIFAGMCS